MNNFFRNTTTQIILGLIALIAITWGSIAILSRHGVDYALVVVSRRDLAETVSATGNVVSNQNVTLAFNMQGKVSSVDVDVGSTTYAGQILASLDTGALQASLSGAQADVLSAEAHLEQVQNGARPEEVALYAQKYRDANVALISSMKSAYLAMTDAIVSKADTLFINGNTINPTLNIRTESDLEKRSTEQERLRLHDTLASLQDVLAELNAQSSDVSSVATSSILSARSAVTSELTDAKTYLDDLGLITGNLSTGNSGQSQPTIDSERAIVNAAAQEVTGAMSSEEAVDAAWSAARDSLTLEEVGGTSEDVEVAEAALGKAQSEVEGLQSQLRQSSIVSPYAGVVTAMNVKVGEIYVPGISAEEGISVIGNGSYQIEAYVPETDIGKIRVSDPVAVTFDAFGSGNVFPAHVDLVDPAETVQNGVNAYKVTVDFDNQSDARIKSGLTANVIITTKTESGALAVPTRAIISRGDNKIVLVKDTNDSQYSEKQVQTGIVSADGYTDIVSGLNEGDIIAGFGSGQ